MLPSVPFLAARVGGGASRSCRRPLRYHSHRRRRRGESFLQGVTLEPLAAFVLRAGLEPAEWPPCSVLGISRHLRPQFSTSNCQRHFTTSKTLGAALVPIASRRRAHRRRQTPPTGAAMKLFAYEHPSGPVHEVEVTLGDTAHWRRLRRSNALTRPRRRHDASAAPSRATAAGPPTQIQDRAGHARFGAGINAIEGHTVIASAGWRGVHEGPRTT